MQGLTSKEISATPRRVGRKQVNFESMVGRFPDGTFARMDKALTEGENRSDLLRVALERELQRRKS